MVKYQKPVVSAKKVKISYFLTPQGFLDDLNIFGDIYAASSCGSGSAQCGATDGSTGSTGNTGATSPGCGNSGGTGYTDGMTGAATANGPTAGPTAASTQGQPSTGAQTGNTSSGTNG